MNEEGGQQMPRGVLISEQWNGPWRGNELSESTVCSILSDWDDGLAMAALPERPALLLPLRLLESSKLSSPLNHPSHTTSRHTTHSGGTVCDWIGYGGSGTGWGRWGWPWNRGARPGTRCHTFHTPQPLNHPSLTTSRHTTH